MGEVAAGPSTSGGGEARKVGPADWEFPPLLGEIPRPPGLLWVTGLPLGPAPYVAVVGSRKPTPYGREVARWVGRSLGASGVVVVSGLARGVDAAAHQGALDAGGPTVAVLGCGLDVCYPARNRALYREIRQSGTLISEYPAGTQPRPGHFPVRNRIIAGMSLAAVVVEGRPDGGAMITARLAMEFGREVFAVPGPIHSRVSEGPHRLIRDGAGILTTPEDVLEELGLSGQLRLEQEGALRPEERKVLETLNTDPLVLDAIARSGGLPMSSTSAILARLEVRGMVVRHPGGRFTRAPGVPSSSF